MIFNIADKIKEILKSAMNDFLKFKPDVQVELTAHISEVQSFRLAKNELIQPINEFTARITARVIEDKKTGIAVSNFPVKEEVLKTIEIAYELSKSQLPREEAGLPERALKHKSQIELDSNLLSVQKNIEKINEWLLFAKEAKAFLSGKYQVSQQGMIVVNSQGTEAEHLFPLVKVEFIAEKGEISGFGSYLGYYLDTFLIQLELERAISKASHYGNVVEIMPGEYEVILEPEAACEFIELFAIYGFGAKQYQEDRSYICGKIGNAEFSETINLEDNHKFENQIQLPFDYEGVHKQKVELIKNGVISGIVYDTETARKEGKKSTGHALPLPNPHGPAPINLCLKPGKKTLEEMISKVEKGILITRLNYTNIEDEKRGVITGMTRDGTFLIEKGEIAEPLVDLRFVQSVPEALKKVKEVGNESKLVSPLFGFSSFPPIKIEGFKITGVKKKQ